MTLSTANPNCGMLQILEIGHQIMISQSLGRRGEKCEIEWQF
jgi:hypothetical protein